MSEDTGGIRAQLARIEGKQDVTNERLETANRINDERHQTVRADIARLDDAHHRVSSRVTTLEMDKHQRDGERSGIATSTKVLWAGVTLLSGGIGAAIMRLSGTM